jgi:hypothetical protein
MKMRPPETLESIDFIEDFSTQMDSVELDPTLQQISAHLGGCLSASGQSRCSIFGVYWA